MKYVTILLLVIYLALSVICPPGHHKHHEEHMSHEEKKDLEHLKHEQDEALKKEIQEKLEQWKKDRLERHSFSESKDSNDLGEQIELAPSVRKSKDSILQRKGALTSTQTANSESHVKSE